MAGNTKLLLVALCGAVLAASALHVSAAAEPTAYRGGAVNSAVAGALQQQQASTAAGQASVTHVQPMKVVPSAYRDKPSLKDYYYGKKTDDYAAPGAAYGNPGYNSQLPNPSYQAPYAQQQQAAQQPMAGAAYYSAPQQQTQYPYQGYQQQQQPQYPQYPQQPQQPQYPQYQQPHQPRYQYPQQPPAYQHPEGGYYPAPTPKPYYPPAPAPYYAPHPTPKPYYPKPDHKPVSSICQSEVFGAFYTQPYDDVITPDHELSGVVSAFMGCKDRLTLGGMCSYTCYDGNYLERFVGTTTRITTMPPQDWDNVEPWDHPVYCAWDLGHMALKSMPPPPQIQQEGFNFSCDFTIKAICCDDIVPHVPYGGDVDLGDGGGDGCTDDSCNPPIIDCETNPDDVCCICDPETDCPEECLLKIGKSKNGTRTSTPKKGSKSINKRGKKSKRAALASEVGSGHEVGFTTIGNAKVTGGVRTPKQDLATSMQAKSSSKAQPAVLVPALSAAAAKANAPTVQLAAQKVSVKVPAQASASTNAVPAGKANSQSR